MISTFCDETSNADVYCVGGYLFKPENYRLWLANNNPTMTAFVGTEHGVASFYCLSSFKDWVKDANCQDGIDYEFEAGNKAFMDEVGTLMNKIGSNPALRETFRYRR